LGWQSNAISLVLHGVAIGIVGLTAREETDRAPTRVTIRAYEKAPAEPEPEPPPPPPPPPPPAPRPKRPAPVPAASAAVAPDEPPPAAPLLELGLVLSNDAPAGVGIAVPVAPSSAKPAAPAAETAPPPPPPSRSRSRPACAVPPTKPMPRTKTRIDYPREARARGVEGRVVLRIHVGADGVVERVEVLESAGAILDESVAAAVRRWTFAPATACGEPVGATYTIARRFELGE
jgi:protein TonB